MTVFLTDVDDAPRMNGRRAEVSPKYPPASFAFIVKRLIPEDLRVVIDTIAIVD